MKRTAGKNALAFVIISVMIDSIGLGIIIPVLPNLLTELTGSPLNEAAIHGGGLTFVYALMRFLFMPILGALSDAFGRRKIMITSMFFLGLDYIIMGLAPSLVFLYLGRTLSGMASATYATANSFIADISPPEKRAQNFGLIGAAFGIGFILGPAIGGVLSEFGTRVPFFAAAAFSFANVIYGLIFLPETLAKEHRRKFSFKRANPLGTFKSIIALPQLGLFLSASFLFSMAHYVYPSSYSFYTQEKFAWSGRDVGISLAFFGLISVFVQGVLIRKSIPKLGMVKSAFIGIAFGCIAYFGLAFSVNSQSIYLFLVVAALGGLASPAIMNLMSVRVPKNAQGELQGANGAITGLAMVFSPLLMTRLFEHFGDRQEGFYFPGAPFVFAGILVILGALVFIMAVKTVQPVKQD